MAKAPPPKGKSSQPPMDGKLKSLKPQFQQLAKGSKPPPTSKTLSKPPPKPPKGM